MNRKQKRQARWGPLLWPACIVMAFFLAMPGLSIAEERFDENIAALLDSYNNTPMAYQQSSSSERTLNEYYARRQYPGSPPFIPHPAVEVYGDKLACLSCHGRGGWSEVMKRFAPVTPHPELQSCRQCHVPVNTRELFVENDWVSVTPPSLGRAHLAGGPPPIPHSLQMRGNCYACHVGPGAVTPIRVEHPGRGLCRQCHVPEANGESFTR